MINAIVYNSLTGSCEKYAKLLSAKLHIPAKPLGEQLRPDCQVMYIGWAFAGKVAGYSKAKKKYNIMAVVNVGMGGAAPNAAENARKASDIPSLVKVFSLQGGFYMEKLPLPYQLIMKIKNKDIAKRYVGKSQLSPSEQALNIMATTGHGDPATWDVSEIVKWAEEYNKE